MDINRQISAEKYVDVCIESFVFVFGMFIMKAPYTFF